jgi:thiol-disulfide isomerase/thioredoxin
MKQLCSIVLIVLSLACSLKNEDKNIKSYNNEIVIIFNSTPENRKLFLNNDDKSPYITFKDGEISYINDSFIEVNFQPKYAPASDTLVIETIRNFVEIRHKYRVLDEFSFLARQGDTLYFNYHGDDIVVSKKGTGKDTQYDLNVDLMKYKRFYTGDYPAYVKYKDIRSFIFIEHFPDFNRVDQESYKQEVRDLAFEQFGNENMFLDSLYNLALISPDVYQYNLLKLKFSRASIEMDTSGPTPVMGYLNSGFDSLVQYRFYRDFLLKAGEALFNPPVIKLSDRRFPDFREYFDLILNSNIFETNAKNFLMQHCLVNIVDNFSNKEILNYAAKYLAATSDSVYHQYFIEKFNLNAPVSDLLLLDHSDNEISFNQLLENNKGKIIYIDFWASWCKPCREAMPHSMELIKHFEEKEILFLFLSIDENKKSWNEASQKENLNSTKNMLNFLVANRHTSDFLDKIKLQGIPRYVIVDKNGKIVYLNAPGPADQNTKHLLLELIRQ